MDRLRAFEWLYLRNPARDPSAGYLGADIDGRLEGMWGRMPVQLYAGGSPVAAVFSHDALVNPACRGQGIASGLLRAITADTPWLLSLWHNERIVSILQKQPWRRIVCARPFKRVFRTDRLLAAKLRAPWLTPLLRATDVLACPLPWRAPGRRPQYQVHPIRRFTADHDALFQAVAADGRVIVERTSRILNWRYADIPYRRYELLEAREGERLVGYLVYRIEGAEGGMSEGIITDLLTLPRREDAVVAMLGAAERSFREQGVDFAVTYMSYGPMATQLRRAGYGVRPAMETACVWVLGLDRAPDQVRGAGADSWYVTRGDCDGDMW
jgi:hypothetical protein